MTQVEDSWRVNWCKMNLVKDTYLMKTRDLECQALFF